MAVSDLLLTVWPVMYSHHQALMSSGVWHPPATGHDLDCLPESNQQGSRVLVVCRACCMTATGNWARAMPTGAVAVRSGGRVCAGTARVSGGGGRAGGQLCLAAAAADGLLDPGGRGAPAQAAAGCAPAAADPRALRVQACASAVGDSLLAASDIQAAHAAALGCRKLAWGPAGCGRCGTATFCLRSSSVVQAQWHPSCCVGRSRSRPSSACITRSVSVVPWVSGRMPGRLGGRDPCAGGRGQVDQGDGRPAAPLQGDGAVHAQ